jgi:transposase-like protein
MADGRPLPLRPVGSVEIGPGVHLLETDEGGAVFLDGMASWCYEPDDVIGRRLAAVQLSETKAARPGAIAAAFGIEYETLRRWRMAWRESGVEGLVPQKTGMKGPYKLIEDKRRETAELHAQGLGLRAMQGLSAGCRPRPLDGAPGTSWCWSGALSFTGHHGPRAPRAPRSARRRAGARACRAARRCRASDL